MRIETVNAVAFGPFTDETLQLAPGMNVIYGPNESGKSSWHAAIYAALCGMRRTRGQPTREDRAFASRHRPWRGTTWGVVALVALDDGRTIEIDQRFGTGGRSVATDRSTKKPLTGDIMRGGAVDAATLLGLTRETALATLFVRQADVLRVLTDAGALQEYLERAAATSTADTTADEALARIAAYKRDRVGLLREGSRGPLAVASRQLNEARDALDQAEDRFESYQELLARRHTAEAEVREVEQRLREVVDYEHERQRRERWQEIRGAERRLEQARQLADQVASGPQDAGPGKELVTAVTGALAAFEARPSEPAPLQGPTSEELEQELADMPDVPEGDLEPALEVTTALDRWRSESQRLAVHDENEPSVGESPTLAAAPSELRRLADEFELAVPDVDPLLVDEVVRRRAAPAAPPMHPPPEPSPRSPLPMGQARAAGGTSRLPIAIGGSVALAGIALAAVGQPIVGGAMSLVGVVVVAAVIALARTPAAPVPPPTPLPEPPAAFAPDLELTRLEARLALQEESQAQAQRRRDGAAARAAELRLPADPGALRQVAAESEAAASAQSRHAEWEHRRLQLEQGRSTAAGELRAALSRRGMGVDQDADLERAFSDYVETCRRRADLARRASRRPDLEAQLVSRRSAEVSRDHDLAARSTAEQQLLDVARQAGCEVPSIDEMAGALRDWTRSQQQVDEVRQAHDRTVARLDQVLDGRTLGELELEIDALRAAAGDPPDQDAPALDDRSAELETLRSRVRQRRDTLAELVGQIEGSERDLLDVSQAIEAEARADAEVRRLTALAEDLDMASEILGAAQQKVHADIAPVLNETIRPWVPRITRGRYDDIRVNPATLELEAHEAGGQFRAAEVLSHGTTEQLFLLLRLALAQRLTTTGEKAPIILDDITVQSDAERTVAALELLHELSAEHQVVLFSQEGEVLSWAHERLKPPSDQLIRLSEST